MLPPSQLKNNNERSNLPVFGHDCGTRARLIGVQEVVDKWSPGEQDKKLPNWLAVRHLRLRARLWRSR